MAVTGLECVDCLGPWISPRTGKPTKSLVDRYRYPPQECEIREGAELHQRGGGTFGKVVECDRLRRTLDIKTTQTARPVSAFVSERVSPDVLSDAICRIAEGAAAHGLGNQAPNRAAIDLLMRRAPRVAGTDLASTWRHLDESTVQFATRIVGDLDDTLLPIQGPPGSGKTYAGARMIVELIRQGRRVGVTANSHKVIRNLIDAALSAAAAAGPPVKAGHKVGEVDAASTIVREFDDNNSPLAALHARQIRHCSAATSYLWARPEYADAVDVLFVDEAGQMSLANALAVSHAARSLVLLGDPRQLEQPQKGSHPDGVGVSALDHILGPHATMPVDRGLFLPETWRLAPPICLAASELLYEGKLSPAAGVERVRLSGAGRFEGAGIWIVPVEHEGNRNASDEEVEAVVALVDEILAPGARWTDASGGERPLTDQDVLVVAPYNAHVNRVDDRLRAQGRAIRVGTVDRFQGQEAPVVIYTMATSSPDEAPRGLEFLYSANRLNVATSRAKAAAIIVASPKLFTPECRTPRQMGLANALCRLKELSL